MYNFTAHRLRNFTVAVGDDVSSRDSFDPDNFTQCVHVPEQFKEGETRILPCDRPVIGQYVAVYMNRKEELTLCEVEVYGIPVEGKCSSSIGKLTYPLDSQFLS